MLLPFGLLDVIKRIKFIESVVVDVQHKQEVDANRSLDEKEKSQELVGQLLQTLQKLDKTVYETATLSAMQSDKLSEALSEMQTSIMQQIREISTSLKVELLANTAGIESVISTQLAHSHKNQTDLLQQLDNRIAEVNTLAKEQYNRISDDLFDTQASIAQQIKESSTAIKFDLPANARYIKNAISTQLTHSHKTQSELLHQLDKRIAEAVSLSVHHSDKSSNALAYTLVSIAQPIKESLAALKVELPANTADIKNTISIQLTHSQKTQSQILQQLDKRITEIAELSDREITAFNKDMSKTIGGLTDKLVGVSTDLRVLGPQFERIELYGLTTAQRVAIHCGENAVMVRTKVGYLLCAADDYALIATLIESGDLEPGTRKLIQRVLAPGDVFVDVGANIGMHTIAAAHAMRGLGKVIAFEPFEPTAHLLEKSILLNGFAGLVDIHRAAATNTSVSRALYLGDTSGHHSLFPRGGETASSKVVQVRSVAIDDVIPATEQITLIKIDVEGAELEVLEGAKLLLGANPNIGLIVEFGPCFLQRSGIETADWLSKFTSFDLEGWEINDVSGELEKISIENLEKKNSSNLFFVNRKSMIFEKATSPT
jgi:FkbM family methyltransferase